MVLTLFDICRVKVRDELEKGNFVRVHQLHPSLRQSVLNVVLMHGTINDPNCKEILGSQEFLDGMTLFDTQLGSVDDHKYLQRVATSLSGVSADGRTIGAKIIELRLTLHGWNRANRYWIDVNRETGTGNLRSVVNVIAQCPKLEKLSFRTRDHRFEDTFGLELLFGDGDGDGLLFGVETCHNLTALIYGALLPAGIEQDNQTYREGKQATWALFPLFSDKIRAAQLRSLHLFGDYDRKILAAVVSNCINVSDFAIRNCPQLSNEHLIEWARRGVALSKLSIKDCNGVTDDGLVPLLISSGSKLIKFSVSLPNISDRTYRTCIEHCRYLKDFDDDGIPRFQDLAASKLFWKQDFI